MSITLLKNAGVSFAGTQVTDHNRSPIEMDTERIEQAERMADGTMRKYHVADKHSFSFDWEMIPDVSTKTVDGHWGADAIQNFYTNNTDPFVLTITYANGSTDTFTVFFDSFDKSLEKRWGDTNYYNVSVSLVEV